MTLRCVATCSRHAFAAWTSRLRSAAKASRPGRREASAAGPWWSPRPASPAGAAPVVLHRDSPCCSADVQSPRSGSSRSASLASLPGLLALLLLLLSLAVPQPALAMLQASPGETGTGLVRSLESLRDLDYQSWQVVAYREGAPAQAAPVTLRIVGYPGRVRLDHPTPLLVRAGRRLWQLDDITLANPRLAADTRAAAAEFDLTPLLADLQNNRPLRLELPGIFVELPIPPYVVEEWRALPLEAGP
ncbi:DUF3122 domain-containing protein [Synechococcus sp. CBW1004]|nr:DUF3122 domain-containing protein [Synechococcus sp. CBW1004]